MVYYHNIKVIFSKTGQKYDFQFLKTQKLHIFFNFPKEKRSNYIFSISQRKNAVTTYIFQFSKGKTQ